MIGRGGRLALRYVGGPFCPLQYMGGPYCPIAPPRKRAPLSTRTLRNTLPLQLSMAGVALLAEVALFLPTATWASTT